MCLWAKQIEDQKSHMCQWAKQIVAPSKEKDLFPDPSLLVLTTAPTLPLPVVD